MENYVLNKHPFDETPIVFSFPKMEDGLSGRGRDEWIATSVRFFVKSQLKPRMALWLAALPRLTPEQVLKEKQRNFFSDVADVVMQFLGKFDPSPSVSKEIRASLPSYFIGEHELKEVSKRIMPFFLQYYSYFISYRALLRTDQKELLSPYLPMERIDTKYTNDEGMGVYLNYRQLICSMMKSELQLCSLIGASLHLAYIQLCRFSFRRIIKCTGYLTMSQIRAVIEVMQQWLSSFPSDVPKNSFDPDLIASKALPTIHTMVIDLLVDRIYALTVLEYPHSFWTIIALRTCLLKSSDYGRDRLATRLVEDVNQKLLSVAVDTSSILDGYANCVDSLRELDPSCSIMQRVCAVIKDYLKKRPDTVRKIINYITSEKRDQLSEHIVSGDHRGTVLDEEEFANTNDEFLSEAMDPKTWKKWLPDPPDAAPGQSSHVRQSADVFNMLISVYGSKDLFVKEYRKLLAERLTACNQKDVEFEERYIDVLKQRFSEGELQQCEVMLKDIEESLEIDVLASAKQGIPITASVISSHFWPVPEQEEVQKMPDALEYALTQHHEAYKEYKSRRRLNYMRSGGFVDVTIELGGVTVEKVVSNTNAAVLYLFLRKDSWALAEVMEQLQMSKALARRRLDWWTNEGLLIQELPPGATDEQWTLVASAASVERSRQEDESEDEDQAAIEDAADAIEGLEIYWSYTQTMIKQNENVKAERIHKLFRMFFSPSGAPTLETVSAFLFRKVQQNLLSYQNGNFSVVSTSS